jgi:D-alanine-D-alanine ligase-like ATP-grasp enzyme
MEILIINSKGYWMNGWAIEPSKLEVIIKVLQKPGLKVRSIEVDSVEELESLLDDVSPDTLVWVNAYWVKIDDNKVDWLSAYVEKRNLPLIGQSQKTLNSLLKKDVCQAKLSETKIPAPQYIIIEKNKINAVERIIFENNIEFPLVAKPTNESRSSGIKIIKDVIEAKEYVKSIFKKYPDGNIIMEEFLPNDDVTCGYIQLKDEYMLLPNYLVVKGMNCENEIYGEKHYLLSPSEIEYVCVKDESILNQFEKYTPAIVDLFDIQSITRVDARMNKAGVLNFFDINGMPGLNFPSSAIIKQCVAHFPGHDIEYIFECLINTILYDKLFKYNVAIPSEIEEHNLFNLESKTVIKLAKKVQVLDMSV